MVFQGTKAVMLTISNTTGADSGTVLMSVISKIERSLSMFVYLSLPALSE